MNDGATSCARNRRSPRSTTTLNRSINSTCSASWRSQSALLRAVDLWVQASLDQKQRLQQLYFPEGIGFDGNRFNRTAATAPFFKCLPGSESADENVVSREGIEPSTRRLRVC